MRSQQLDNKRELKNRRWGQLAIISRFDLRGWRGCRRGLQGEREGGGGVGGGGGCWVCEGCWVFER